MGLLLIILSAPTSTPIGAQLWHGATPIYGYKVVNTYPHDRGAFTQGLVFRDGLLFEGTGLYGRSSIRTVRWETGEIVRSRGLPAEVFGEGVTLWRNRLIQLTWRSETGYIYDTKALRLIGRFHYRGEGWGITQDGKHLIMSDGSDTLRFLEPDGFAEIRTLAVRDNGSPVANLNELEYVEGQIYANVFPTDRIARICPETGRVLGWIDLSGLLARDARTPGTDVLNGIAWDDRTKRLFVTGKFWPILFEISLVPLPSARNAMPENGLWS